MGTLNTKLESRKPKADSRWRRQGQATSLTAGFRQHPRCRNSLRRGQTLNPKERKTGLCWPLTRPHHIPPSPEEAVFSRTRPEPLTANLASRCNYGTWPDRAYVEAGPSTRLTGKVASRYSCGTWPLTR